MMTLGVKLQPTTDQAQASRRTMVRFNAACHALAQSALRDQTANKIRLQKLVYAEIRETSGAHPIRWDVRQKSEEELVQGSPRGSAALETGKAPPPSRVGCTRFPDRHGHWRTPRTTTCRRQREATKRNIGGQLVKPGEQTRAERGT